MRGPRWTVSHLIVVPAVGIEPTTNGLQIIA